MKENMYQLIGKNLRFMREKERMTVCELVEKSGISHTTINNIENGKAKNLELETVDRLANALGVDLQRFFSPLNEKVYFVGWHYDLMKELEGGNWTCGSVDGYCHCKLVYAESVGEAVTKFLEAEFFKAYKEKENIPDWFEDVKEKAANAYIELSMYGDDLPEGMNELFDKLKEEISGKLWDISKPSSFGDGHRCFGENEENEIKAKIDIDKLKNMFSNKETKMLYVSDCFYDVVVIPIDYLDETASEELDEYDFSGMWKAV